MNPERFFSFFPSTSTHHANGDNQLFCSQEEELGAECLPSVIAKVTRFRERREPFLP